MAVLSVRDERGVQRVSWNTGIAVGETRGAVNGADHAGGAT